MPTADPSSQNSRTLCPHAEKHMKLSLMYGGAVSTYFFAVDRSHPHKIANIASGRQTATASPEKSTAMHGYARVPTVCA